jgi:serine/threonine protein kinase
VSVIVSYSVVLLSIKHATWKLADFGFTSEAVEPANADTNTYRRVTSGYRAPELADGRRRNATKSTDVWVLGCIFYELLTLRKMFQDDFKVSVAVIGIYLHPGTRHSAIICG